MIQSWNQSNSTNTKTAPVQSGTVSGIQSWSSPKVSTPTVTIPQGTSILGKSLLSSPPQISSTSNSTPTSLFPKNENHLITFDKNPIQVPPQGIINNLGIELANKLPNTAQTFKAFLSDPFSTNNFDFGNIQDYKKVGQDIVNTAWSSIKSSVQNDANTIADLFDSSKTTSQKIGSAAAVIPRTLGVILSPITGAFAGGEKVPILGVVPKSIDFAFQALGESGSYVGEKLVDKLPLTPEDKQNIKPAVKETFALASQIVAGKASLGDIPQKLVDKYGFDNAKIIADKASEMADRKTNSTFPTSDVTPKEVLQQLNEPKSPIVKSVDTGNNVTDAGFPKANPVPLDVRQPKVDPLIAEARKYKSAEEFVKVQGNPKTIQVWKKSKFSNEGAYADIPVIRKEENVTLYHGGEEGQFWSPNKKYAEQFGKVTEKTGTFYKVDNGNRVTDVYVEAPTKAQLTDIWKQANETTKPLSKTVPTPKTRTILIKNEPLATPEIKTSKLATGVEQKAIEAGLTKGFEGLPEYAKVNVKSQAEAAQRLISEDPKLAYDVALGKKLPPEGILPESVFVALEQHAHLNGDISLLRDLATSGLTSEATGMGQRIRMLAERNPDSPVARIQEVVKAREDAIVKQTKSKNIEEVKNKVIESVKKEIKKTNTKQTWSDFVESIRC